MKFKNCVYGLSTRQAAAGDAHKLTECTHTQPEHRAERTQHVHNTRTLRHSTRAEPPPAAAASSKQQQRNSSKRVRVKRSRTQQSAASKNVKKPLRALCSALLSFAASASLLAVRCALSRLLSFCGENRFSVLCAAACDSERERKSATILHCRSQRAWPCVCVYVCAFVFDFDFVCVANAEFALVCERERAASLIGLTLSHTRATTCAALRMSSAFNPIGMHASCAARANCQRIRPAINRNRNRLIGIRF